jgi:dephospho-CoA kinase
LTARELEVLTHWWMTGSVKKAAQAAGVGEQRAKNMLARARMRSRVHSNDELLAAHMDAVRSLVQERMQHKSSQADAA